MHHDMSPTAEALTTRPHRTTRRRLLAAALAVPLILGGAACGGDEAASGANDKVELSIYWWGAEARAALTEKALALYTSKHPNVTFAKTWQANQGYFDKLATLTAGGNPPDIFQIDDNYLAEYASQVEAVRAGLAVALVPRLGRPPLPDGVVAVPVSSPAPTRQLLLIWRTTMTDSAAVRELRARLPRLAAGQLRQPVPTGD